MPGHPIPAGWTAAAVTVFLVGVVLLAHWPEVSGWLSANPLPWAAHIDPRVPETVLPGLPGWNDPNVGVTTQALGGLAARDWLGGSVPWWNPYSGVGLPLAAEMQNSALFLPFVLLLRFGNGLLLLKVSLQLVASLATYGLLRQLALRRPVAAVGAACFGLNGTFAWMGHGPIMPVAFLPLLLLGVERAAAAARRRAAGGWFWIAVALGYSIVSGFPETAYLDGLFAGLWTLVRLARIEAAARHGLARKAVLGVAVGLLLAMPALLPFLQALPQSSLTYHDQAQPFVLPLVELPLFLTPYVYGPISYAGQWLEGGLMGGYLQLGLLPLCVLALAGGGTERALRWTVALWCVATLAQTQGLPGVVPLLDILPFIRKTVLYRYVWPTWELGTVLLACLAAEDWLSGRIGRRRIAFAAAAGAALAAAGASFGREHIGRLLGLAPHYRSYLLGSGLWAVVVLAATTVLLMRAPGRRAGIALGGVLVTEAVALFGFPLLSGIRREPLDLPAIRFLQNNIGLSRMTTLGPITPNYGAYFGIASIDVDYLPVLRLWMDYSDRRLRSRTASPEDQAAALRDHLPAYQAAGVRFVVVNRDADPFGTMKAAPRLAYADPFMEIYELPSPAPYFSVDGGRCTLAEQGRTRLVARCDRPSSLLRRELMSPGWSARVNRQAVPMRRGQDIFQRIGLPRGRSTVTFSYAPPHIGYAYAALLLGLAGLGAGIRLEGRTTARPDGERGRDPPGRTVAAP